MSWESFVRKHAEEDGLTELRDEFGIDLDQAVEIHWRVTRVLLLGIQIGALGSILAILVVLGGWALWRGIMHR